MNPDAHQIWRAPRWALAALLALIGMIGPFSVDTYIPAFSGIAASLRASPVEMQQTLSGYLFGFAFMSLFHGAISDSFGRRPVLLWGVAIFALASLGCALSQSIGQLVFFRVLQGLSTGAGIVVSRAIIRDMYEPAQAQKVMSQVTIYFGIAPAIAPIIGGWLFVLAGWHSIFWFFILSISGIMSGAWLSGRMAGKISPRRQIRYGFAVMLGSALVNFVANYFLKAQVAWALFPVAAFGLGWALMVPAVTLLVLDLHPDRRGMASSLQMFVGASANGMVAGVIAPLVMHSTMAMASASLVMLCVGLFAWVYLLRFWPGMGGRPELEY